MMNRTLIRRRLALNQKMQKERQPMMESLKERGELDQVTVAVLQSARGESQEEVDKTEKTIKRMIRL